MENETDSYIETSRFERAAIGFCLGIALIIGSILLLAGSI